MYIGRLSFECDLGNAWKMLKVIYGSLQLLVKGKDSISKGFR